MPKKMPDLKIIDPHASCEEITQESFESLMGEAAFKLERKDEKYTKIEKITGVINPAEVFMDSSDFSLEKMVANDAGEYWRMSPFCFVGESWVVEFTSDFLPNISSDVGMIAHNKNVTNKKYDLYDGFIVASAPLYFAIFNALLANREHPQCGRAVESARADIAQQLRSINVSTSTWVLLSNPQIILHNYHLYDWTGLNDLNLPSKPITHTDKEELVRLGSLWHDPVRNINHTSPIEEMPVGVCDRLLGLPREDVQKVGDYLSGNETVVTYELSRSPDSPFAVPVYLYNDRKNLFGEHLLKISYGNRMSSRAIGVRLRRLVVK